MYINRVLRNICERYVEHRMIWGWFGFVRTRRPGGSLRGSKGVDTAEYLIENSKCTCVGVQKKGQNGGYVLNTKTHKNFWLLAWSCIASSQFYMLWGLAKRKWCDKIKKKYKGYHHSSSFVFFMISKFLKFSFICCFPPLKMWVTCRYLTYGQLAPMRIKGCKNLERMPQIWKIWEKNIFIIVVSSNGNFWLVSATMQEPI